MTPFRIVIADHLEINICLCLDSVTLWWTASLVGFSFGGLGTCLLPVSITLQSNYSVVYLYCSLVFICATVVLCYAIVPRLVLLSYTID